jgi:hypothetical protein
MKMIDMGITTQQLVACVREASDDWLVSIPQFLALNANRLAAELAASIGHASDNTYSDFMLASREVSTHYKWLIAADNSDSWKIWLHQYKDGRVSSDDYADVPHNHRYNYISLILSGGYDNIEYLAGGNEVVTPTDVRSVDRGQTISLDHRQIHSLTRIRPSTLSLFIQGKIRKESSLSYPADGLMQVHESLESALEKLREGLSNAL